jgi:putative tricarboxylic transport membrane protein
MGFVAAGIIVNVFLMERAGFVLASTLLFWLTARAFDRTRPVRDVVFALGVAVATYLLFARVLQLSLPAGVLRGWN